MAQTAADDSYDSYASVEQAAPASQPGGTTAPSCCRLHTAVAVLGATSRRSRARHCSWRLLAAFGAMPRDQERSKLAEPEPAAAPNPIFRWSNVKPKQVSY